MAMVMIYVFEEPREWKKRSAKSFSFMYTDQAELEKHLQVHIQEPGVYHVTAFNTYGNLVAEIYKSKNHLK